MDVYLEIGTKRVFAAAVDWPGWCRAGKDEESALEALFEYAPRYVKVVGTSADFRPPKTVSELIVTERIRGDATTDYGAPGAIPEADKRPLADGELAQLEKLFDRCWAAFRRAAKGAAGHELAKGPRGGGREQHQIEEHVSGAEESYAAQVGLRGELTAAVRARAAGQLPDRGPRGGERWPARYGIRRAAWHVLDHAWEIEDRLQPG